MRVALVFPPYSHKIFSENLSTVDEEFCLAPPIILAYVAAILEKHGHTVMLLDARALKLSKEEALEKIAEFKPDMLGFRSETYHFHDALAWISYLKKKLGLPVITGGVNMDLYPGEVMGRDEIDYGIIGEAINSLPEFIRALENGDDYSGIAGVAYKDKDKRIFLNKPSAEPVDLDGYPFPARHLLPNDKYYSFISQRKNFTILLTSSGCPFGCTFCAIPSAYRYRSPVNVVDEIEHCCREFGVREIDFFDAVLFMPEARVLEIFRQIRERKLDIQWSARSRVDVMNEGLLKEAALSGCRQIYYGIESVDQEVLDNVNKRITPEQVREIIGLSAKYGIRSMGFFMVGNPGDTARSVRSTIDFAKSINLDFIQVCRTIAKPGTQLDKELIRTTGIDHWREHVRSKPITKRLPTPWSGLGQSEAAKLTKEFYLKFYFRPKIIFSRIFQSRSLPEILRFVRVGSKIFFRKPAILERMETDYLTAEYALTESRRLAGSVNTEKACVVIPTLNEKENISRMIGSVGKFLPAADIIVVDDGSTDGTVSVVKEEIKNNPKLHLYIRTGKQGLGNAYKEAFAYVLDNFACDYIIQMDADLSHKPDYLPLFLRTAAAADLVIGSRFLNKVTIKNRKFWRNFVSITSKLIFNRMMGMNITDITSGFKCWRVSLLRRVDFKNARARGFAFQIETNYLANRKKALIKELPILFEERTRGSSKMSAGILIEGLWIVFFLTFKRLLGGTK